MCLSACLWRLSQNELSTALGNVPTVLLNDFAVVGHALPWLPKHRTIVAGSPQGHTLLGVGPGTGLGVVLSHGNDALPCEAGSADFAPRTDLQWALRCWIANEYGVDHVMVEHVVSGAGIANIYRFLIARHGDGLGERSAVLAARVAQASEPGAIIAANGVPGQATSDKICCEAMDLFFEVERQPGPLVLNINQFCL